MNKIKLAILLGMAGLIAVWAFRFFFPNDQNLIRQRLQELAAAAAIRANEAPLERVTNTGRLCGLFTEDLRIAVETGGREFRVSGRQDLFKTVMSVRANYGPVQVEFLDARVELGPDRRSAVAQTAARVRGNLEGEPNFQELKLSLVKIGRQWFVSRVELDRTLRL